LFFIARVYTKVEAENRSANADNKRRRDANLYTKFQVQETAYNDTTCGVQAIRGEPRKK
jgi:hypothetical protein